MNAEGMTDSVTPSGFRLSHPSLQGFRYAPPPAYNLIRPSAFLLCLVVTQANKEIPLPVILTLTQQRTLIKSGHLLYYYLIIIHWLQQIIFIIAMDFSSKDLHFKGYFNKKVSNLCFLMIFSLKIFVCLNFFYNFASEYTIYAGQKG